MRNHRQEAVALARYRIVQTALEQGISHAARHHECSRSTVQRLLRRHPLARIVAAAATTRWRWSRRVRWATF